jgi:hypothetical protein
MDALEIAKRLDLKQNVTIRVIEEATNKVVQEHVGHNAATNSMLTGIAHYLLGDGTLNQGSDMLTSWVPQYISLGTMGLTNQDSETYFDDELEMEVTVPSGVGTTLPAPESATPQEKELNAKLRFTEYLNQCPGFGADGYDENTNNDRPYFGLGLPYDDRPAMQSQDFFSGDGATKSFTLSTTPVSIVSVTIYPNGVVNQDMHDTSVTRQILPSNQYILENDTVVINDNVVAPVAGSRIAIIYTLDNKEAAVCELIDSTTVRSKINFRNIIPEVQSEVPGTLDVIFSAFLSTGELSKYRGDNDYIYITEAGLWSKPTYTSGGDNGLLAGYRIMPSDDEVNTLGVEDKFNSDGTTTEFKLTKEAIQIDSVTLDNVVQPSSEYTLDTTTNRLVFTESAPDPGQLIVIYRTGDVSGTWKDMTVLANRQLVQKNIIRIGEGQVAQIIWKLQLGGLEQLEGLRYLYPSQYPEDVWIVWNS